ncbi:MAG: DUF1016 N-terminal domain-containing protein, partial [Bacteroidales bacterium]|nr:DUF1016 N-terminal domain-containing protein [Bacteroidales bacterium]
MKEEKPDNELPVLEQDYQHFLQDILTKIKQSRYQMQMSVSRQTLLLYWDIGKSVSEKMKADGWGKSVVEKLSKDLQTEFEGVRGFSTRNIWMMKKFYEFYANLIISADASAEISAPTVAEIPNDCKSNGYNSATAGAEIVKVNSAATVAEFPPQLVAEIGWTQNCIILEKCKDLQHIYFYLFMTKEKGWSKNDLLEKIANN